MGEKAQAIGRPGLTPCRAGQTAPPDPEVVAKASRRRFTPEYKLKIVQEADACSTGELGAMLRRDGFYFSNLTCWRRQVAEGQLAALSPQKRGGRYGLQIRGLLSWNGKMPVSGSVCGRLRKSLSCKNLYDESWYLCQSVYRR